MECSLMVLVLTVLHAVFCADDSLPMKTTTSESSIVNSTPIRDSVASATISDLYSQYSPSSSIVAMETAALTDYTFLGKTLTSFVYSSTAELQSNPQSSYFEHSTIEHTNSISQTVSYIAPSSASQYESSQYISDSVTEASNAIEPTMTNSLDQTSLLSTMNTAYSSLPFSQTAFTTPPLSSTSIPGDSHIISPTMSTAFVNSNNYENSANYDTITEHSTRTLIEATSTVGIVPSLTISPTESINYVTNESYIETTTFSNNYDSENTTTLPVDHESVSPETKNTTSSVIHVSTVTTNGERTGSIIEHNITISFTESSVQNVTTPTYNYFTGEYSNSSTVKPGVDFTKTTSSVSVENVTDFVSEYMTTSTPPMLNTTVLYNTTYNPENNGTAKNETLDSITPSYENVTMTFTTSSAEENTTRMLETNVTDTFGWNTTENVTMPIPSEENSTIYATTIEPSNMTHLPDFDNNTTNATTLSPLNVTESLDHDNSTANETIVEPFVTTTQSYVLNTTFEPQNTTTQLYNTTDFHLYNTTFETQNTTFEPQNTTFEMYNTTYEPYNTTFEPHNTTFEPYNTTAEFNITSTTPSYLYNTTTDVLSNETSTEMTTSGFADDNTTSNETTTMSDIGVNFTDTATTMAPENGTTVFVDSNFTTPFATDNSTSNDTTYTNFTTDEQSTTEATTQYFETTQFVPQIRDMSLTVTFDGNCTLLKSVPEYEIEFTKTIKTDMSDLLDVSESDIFVGEAVCGSVIVNVTIFNMTEAIVANSSSKIIDFLMHSNYTILMDIANGTFELKPVDVVIIITKPEPDDEVTTPITTRRPYDDDEGDSWNSWTNLSQLELILVFVFGIIGGFLLILAICYCIYLCCNTSRKQSFSLGDTPSASVSLEDFTLTKIHRPPPVYNERGPFASPEIRDGDIRPPITPYSPLVDPGFQNYSNGQFSSFEQSHNNSRDQQRTSSENLMAGHEAPTRGFDNQSFSSDDILNSGPDTDSEMPLDPEGKTRV